MNGVFEIRYYIEGESERSPFEDWFDALDAQTAERIDRYIRRLESGSFGGTKLLREGACELRMDFGPGYRIYFGRVGRSIIILLGGGSKRRQNADIGAAVRRWKQYKQARG